jgi:hypothetical protein
MTITTPAELVELDEVAKANGHDNLDAEVGKLAKLSPLEFDRVADAMAEDLGVLVTTLRQEVKKARKHKPPKVAAESGADPEKLAEAAADIIASKDVLSLFEKAWAKSMAGEQKNAKILYLVATSRLFKKCMSAAVKGPSSAGKSAIRKHVLDFMPPEDVVSFTTLSEKALLYIEGDFQHKILSMGEAAGAEEEKLQDYLLRELISEGALRYHVVQKIGNELITTEVVKNGPVCFLVTTTKAALHAENETRMLSLEIDDSTEQTIIVIDKVAEVVGLNVEQAGFDLSPWHDFQRWLAAGNCNVVVPFARELGRLIPPRSVRLRRDFSQVLLAVKAHALLHRRHRRVDARGQIVADIALDYNPIAELMGGIVAEASGISIAKEVEETVNAVRVASATLSAEDGATAFEVAKLLKLDKSSAWRRLRVAMEKDYVVNLETRRGQPGRYRLTEQEIKAEELLPSSEDLSGATQPVQPCNPERKTKAEQEDNRLHDRLHDPCMFDATALVEDRLHGIYTPHATDHATGQVNETLEEIATGCTVAPVAWVSGDADDPWADLEIPEPLKRRK